VRRARIVTVQYAPQGIRLNTVIPGQLHTPMVEARLAGQRAGGDVEARFVTGAEIVVDGGMTVRCG
jgi:hypothetical protein